MTGVAGSPVSGKRPASKGRAPQGPDFTAGPPMAGPGEADGTAWGVSEG